MRKNRNTYKRPRRRIECSGDGSEWKEYQSIEKASEDTGVASSSIYRVAVNERITAGGYYWRFKGDKNWKPRERKYKNPE